MNKRLHKEYTDLVKNGEEFVKMFSASPKVQKTLNADGSIQEDLNFQTWSIVVYGQPETPYEGRKFMVAMDFPVEYPMKPPRVKFLTRIYHPNISVEGDVCIDILKQNWTPAFGIEKIMLCLLCILDEPNGNDPLNIEAGRLFVENRAIFNTKAKSYI